MSKKFDALDRRIIGALQINGRASWKTIAEVLGEPLRTVSRRGNELLQSRLVSVVGLAHYGYTSVIEVECDPLKMREAALSVSRYPGIVFAYVLASPSRLMVEAQQAETSVAALVHEAIPAIDGVREVSASPVLHYFRTVAGWHPSLLSEAETTRLASAVPRVEPGEPEFPPSETDRRLIELLVTDGRASLTELADAANLSQPTARRRLRSLLEEGFVSVRAIVDPVPLGFPVEAMLWIQVPPSSVMWVGQMIAEEPAVRYAVMLMGEFQILVHVNMRSLEHLRVFLTDSEWASTVLTVKTSLVTTPFMRGGVPVRGDS
ncbi:AsnC family transcriptional regulator [Lysinibacter sp. HNR]|uniref:Lrp/AsnC family transcriptional regulator n=1 Tax=Lysinibacter sp. HNR TaxID=3031408 RepID=UPI00243609D8|nr:AsnC family transcriptional regulator [Lysinibacter sp. HNR]WGD37130.1 AsnC family transcriptional regulator [Lysinibacter sp. HNR]